ncbi:MAG: nicotinate-nucleotide adenylyltransferase [Bacteroidetes bacterium]|nr:nicotinate-nucleotide adenylyltransferase [Bacteroidota bacterium]
MKIGLFFGSFNPVHIGHMVIVGHMAEFTDLDEVWLVVSPHNPLKEKSSLLNDKHRLQLVKEAIGDNLKIKASNIEFSLPQPSYTIHTLTYLKEKHPLHQFVLLMGSDNLDTFHKWKNYEIILENYELYIYPRKEASASNLQNHKNVKMIGAPLMELSSTFIRNSIKEKKDVRYMLPDAVYKYIKEMHFYEK